MKRLQAGVDLVESGVEPPIEMEVAVAEALWWTMWIDETYFAADSGGYPGRRDKFMGGQLFKALRYVRDRCTHQSPVVMQHRKSGWYFPMRFPIQGSPHMVWGSPARMGDPRHPDPRGHELVEIHLTAKPVLEAFREARKWFIETGLEISVD